MDFSAGYQGLGAGMSTLPLPPEPLPYEGERLLTSSYPPVLSSTDGSQTSSTASRRSAATTRR